MRTDTRPATRSWQSTASAGIRLVAVLAALASVGFQSWHVATNAIVGGDFSPLRHAAQAMLNGTSVYGDPAFVYPPFAAVLLLPTAAGSALLAAKMWTEVGVAALVVAAVLIARQGRPESRLTTGAVAAIALVGGCAATDSLDLGNLSPLLVPLAVATLVAMGKGRWLLGCALLCATLLIKPLLAPLLLVPVIYGHWRELLRAAVPAAVVLGASVAFVPGGTRFPQVFAYDLSGTNLHGRNAGNNLSIAGWLETHVRDHDLATALRIVAVLVVLALAGLALVHSRRQPVTIGVVIRSGNIVMLAALLSGSISEVHFLLVILATSLLQLTVAPSRRAALCLVPGLAMVGAMTSYRDVVIGSHVPQSWFLVAEVALVVGNVTDAVLVTAGRSNRVAEVSGVCQLQVA